MLRHGLCVQESSQGNCFEDGKRCGWRVVECLLRSISFYVQLAIIFLVVAWLAAIYFVKPKPEEPVKKSNLYWKAAPQEPIPVTVTAYSPTVEECDDTPFITAFNKAVRGGTIAVSRDLERVHGWKKGDLIHLEGVGIFEVWDRMNKRWTQRVDVFFFDTSEAKRFGKLKTKAVKL